MPPEPPGPPARASTPDPLVHALRELLEAAGLAGDALAARAGGTPQARTATREALRAARAGGEALKFALTALTDDDRRRGATPVADIAS